MDFFRKESFSRKLYGLRRHCDLHRSRGALGYGWEPTPWHAAQRAAWAGV